MLLDIAQCAVEALGFPSSNFLSAYQGQRQKQNMREREGEKDGAKELGMARVRSKRPRSVKSSFSSCSSVKVPKKGSHKFLTAPKRVCHENQGP